MDSENHANASINSDRIVVPDQFRTAELNTMLRWSALTYAFATLRDIVRDYEATYNDHEEGTIEFQRPELVYTQNSSVTPLYEKTFLKHPITCASIKEFIELNKKYVVGKDGYISFNPEGVVSRDRSSYALRQLSFVDDEFDADIVEFDDEFLGGGLMGLHTELVYSIIVNRTQKRITVMFRGSANLKDFVVDAGIFKTNPVEVTQFSGLNTYLHLGIAGYLFGETSEAFGDSKESKFTQILRILKQIYENKANNGHDYSDYKLYITGHSLGGALTQLLAFTLAGSKEAEFIPKPITGISYASPTVGNRTYYDTFQSLEKEGKLRHIRVSNQGDIVPAAPSIGYYQTGINFHLLNGKRMEIKYHNSKKSMYSQLNLGFISKHSLEDYEKNLFIDENSDVLSMDIEQLYSKFAKH